MKSLQFAAFLGVFLSFSNSAHAFPELVRHGYVNCTSCHVSPTGGGILTDYGRALSKEVLSNGRFFFEKKPAEPAPKAEDAAKQNVDTQTADDSGIDPETRFLYGAVNLPSWLNLGGDIRALQIFQDTPTYSSARFILMQADLEAAVTVDRFRLVGTIGRDEPRTQNPDFGDYVISRRHWLSVLLGASETPEEFQVRFGRFFPAYGIPIAEHTIVTRRGLGFDQSMETYNAEAAYIGEKFNVIATAVLGRPDSNSLNRESGFALQASVPIAATYKVGLNGYTGTNETAPGSGVDSSRDLFGVYGILGFTPHVYSLVEVDRIQTRVTGQDKDTGVADFVKLGYEPWQGVHFFATQEYLDSSKATPPFTAYGVGTQYFPRPHWDFMATYRKERNEAAQSGFSDVVWLIAHYYL